MKSANRPAAKPDSVAPSPLEPRRGLFWILAAVLFVWIIALLLMYWFTVRPERLKQPAEPPGLPFSVPSFSAPAAQP
jgi:hypothetical protein